MSTRTQYHLGDCVEGLRGTDAATFDLTVTSNPYDDLRVFGGHPYTWAVFKAIAEQLWRVTKPGGIVCWQTGDSTHSSGPKKGAYRMTPLRQAIYFDALGFWSWCRIVTPSPGYRFTSPRRYIPAPQDVWVFTKGEPTTVNLLKDRPNVTSGNLVRGSKRDRHGRVILYNEARTTPANGVRGTIWYYSAGSITGEPYTRDHPARMPERLAEDLIRSWSKPGDKVCDPFAGVATTAKMCLLNDREFEGWEIHEPYYAIGERRLRDARKAITKKLLDRWRVVEPV